MLRALFPMLLLVIFQPVMNEYYVLAAWVSLGLLLVREIKLMMLVKGEENESEKTSSS